MGAGVFMELLRSLWKGDIGYSWSGTVRGMMPRRPYAV